jgi:hypothetical protein
MDSKAHGKSKREDPQLTYPSIGNPRKPSRSVRIAETEPSDECKGTEGCRHENDLDGLQGDRDVNLSPFYDPATKSKHI